MKNKESAVKTLDQVSTLSDTDKDLLKEVKESVLARLPKATILLYGSVARGAQEPESDYDILVLTDSPIAFKEQSKIRSSLLDLELTCARVLTLMFSDRIRWATPMMEASPFHREVQQDGIVL